MITKVQTRSCMRPAVILAIAAAVTGCTIYPANVRGSNVVVVASDASVSPQCRFIAEVEATDGKACVACASAYVGTRERALEKLRSKVAIQGGNVLHLRPEQQARMITHHPGEEITLFGRAFRCPE